jgi:hypothetical protein
MTSPIAQAAIDYPEFELFYTERAEREGMKAAEYLAFIGGMDAAGKKSGKSKGLRCGNPPPPPAHHHQSLELVTGRGRGGSVGSSPVLGVVAAACVLFLVAGTVIRHRRQSNTEYTTLPAAEARLEAIAIRNSNSPLTADGRMLGRMAPLLPVSLLHTNTGIKNTATLSGGAAGAAPRPATATATGAAAAAAGSGQPFAETESLLHSLLLLQPIRPIHSHMRRYDRDIDRHGEPFERTEIPGHMA